MDLKLPLFKLEYAVAGSVLLSTCFAVAGFVIISPLLPVWMDEFHISRTQAGFLSGLWYLPGFLFALPAGKAFDTYSPVKLLLLAWSAIVIGLFMMATAPAFEILCAGRLVFSVGAVVHLVGAPKVLALSFLQHRRFGLLMGLYSLAMSSGILFVFAVMGPLAESRGWRPVMAVITVSAVLCWLSLLFIACRFTENSRVGGPSSVRVNSLRSHAPWILAVAYFGFSIGTESYIVFAPDFLVTLNYELGEASKSVAVYAMVSISLKPLTGFFLNRENAPYFVMCASLVCMLSILCLFSVTVPPVIAFILLGISIAMGMPALFALPAYFHGADHTGTQYGLFQLIYSFGFFAQTLIGWLTDFSHSYIAGYALIMLFLVLGTMVCLPVFLTKYQQRGDKDACISLSI